MLIWCRLLAWFRGTARWALSRLGARHGQSDTACKGLSAGVCITPAVGRGRAWHGKLGAPLQAWCSRGPAPETASARPSWTLHTPCNSHLVATLPQLINAEINRQIAAKKVRWLRVVDSLGLHSGLLGVA